MLSADAVLILRFTFTWPGSRVDLHHTSDPSDHGDPGTTTVVSHHWLGTEGS
jgi:hypothetical protein